MAEIVLFCQVILDLFWKRVNGLVLVRATPHI